MEITKELWILLAATIIIFGAIKRFIKWRIKMGIKKKCNTIINDFNIMERVENTSEWRSILMEKYKLSSEDAWDCIKYLKDNGFIVKDPMNESTFYWVKQ